MTLWELLYLVLGLFAGGTLGALMVGLLQGGRDEDDE